MSVKKCLHAILMGIRQGGASLSDSPCFALFKNIRPHGNIISVMVMSGSGIVSSILKTLEDRFPF